MDVSLPVQKKRCKMKKKYFTPETVTVNLNVESYILNDSTRIPVNPEEVKPSAAGSSRGEWGNLW